MGTAPNHNITVSTKSIYTAAYTLVNLYHHIHMLYETVKLTAKIIDYKFYFLQVAQLSLTNPHNALHHGKWQNFKTVT